MSSTFSTDEVTRVAALARIALTPEETRVIAADLGVIAGAVAHVSKAVTPDVPPTSHPIPMTNVLRPDVVTDTMPQDLALRGAPAAQDGRFVVPQILEED